MIPLLIIGLDDSSSYLSRKTITGNTDTATKLVQHYNIGLPPSCSLWPCVRTGSASLLLAGPLFARDYSVNWEHMYVYQPNYSTLAMPVKHVQLAEACYYSILLAIHLIPVSHSNGLRNRVEGFCMCSCDLELRDIACIKLPMHHRATGGLLTSDIIVFVAH